MSQQFADVATWTAWSCSGKPHDGPTVTQAFSSTLRTAALGGTPKRSRPPQRTWGGEQGGGRAGHRRGPSCCGRPWSHVCTGRRSVRRGPGDSSAPTNSRSSESRGGGKVRSLEHRASGGATSRGRCQVQRSPTPRIQDTPHLSKQRLSDTQKDCTTSYIFQSPFQTTSIFFKRQKNPDHQQRKNHNFQHAKNPSRYAQKWEDESHNREKSQLK